MRKTAVIALAIAALGGLSLAQEPKPVPKDSARVSIPGCTKGYIFTVASRSANEAGSNYDIPEGMHLRMNGPKKLINEIKAHQGSMIQLTGLMKKEQLRTDGVAIGGGVRVSPGGFGPGGGQNFIDVEGFRPIPGNCPSR
jgi:hypothetical protein